MDDRSSSPVAFFLDVDACPGFGFYGDLGSFIDVSDSAFLSRHRSVEQNKSN